MADRRKLDAPDPGSRDEPIHTKYRPAALVDVVGQREVVASLSAALRGKARPHAYLFAGPPGTGKTTLARIVAGMCDVPPQSVQEVDAASRSGVDDVRELTAPLVYRGFGDAPNKAIVIDECHRLSKQAWDALLKIVEEPPPHVFFFFCTSEGDKVPAAMARRCLAYGLRAVRHDDLVDLLGAVAKAERLDTPGRVLELVADAAAGSPGLALQLLAKVKACRDPEEAAVLLEQPAEMAEVIDLCRMLVKGDLTWPRLCAVLKGLDVPAESVRIVVVNYVSQCLLGARSDRDARRLLDILSAFLRPCSASDKLGPILDAFGRHIFP